MGAGFVVDVLVLVQPDLRDSVEVLVDRLPRPVRKLVPADQMRVSE